MVLERGAGPKGTVLLKSARRPETRPTWSPEEVGLVSHYPCQAGSTTEGRVPSPHEPVL